MRAAEHVAEWWGAAGAPRGRASARFVGRTNTEFSSDGAPRFAQSRRGSSESPSLAMLGDVLRLRPDKVLSWLASKRHRRHRAGEGADLIEWPLDVQGTARYSHSGGRLGARARPDTFSFVVPQRAAGIVAADDPKRPQEPVPASPVAAGPHSPRTADEAPEAFVRARLSARRRLARSAAVSTRAAPGSGAGASFSEPRDSASTARRLVPWSESCAEIVLHVCDEAVGSLFDRRVGVARLPLRALLGEAASGSASAAGTPAGLQRPVFRWLLIRGPDGSERGEVLVRAQVALRRGGEGDDAHFDRGGGLIERYQELVKMARQFQNGLGALCSAAERVRNLRDWASPAQSQAALWLCFVLAAALFFVPYRALFALIVGHQMTRPLRRRGGIAWRLLSLLRSVPDDPQLERALAREPPVAVRDGAASRAGSSPRGGSSPAELVPDFVCSGYLRCTEARRARGDRGERWVPDAGDWERLFWAVDPKGYLRCWRTVEGSRKYARAAAARAAAARAATVRGRSRSRSGSEDGLPATAVPLRNVPLTRAVFEDQPAGGACARNVSESLACFVVAREEASRGGVLFAADTRAQREEFRACVEAVRRMCDASQRRRGGRGANFEFRGGGASRTPPRARDGTSSPGGAKRKAQAVLSSVLKKR
jgi:hypothetical protein